jgi:hypothetical protein
MRLGTVGRLFTPKEGGYPRLPPLPFARHDSSISGKRQAAADSLGLLWLRARIATVSLRPFELSIRAYPNLSEAIRGYPSLTKTFLMNTSI